LTSWMPCARNFQIEPEYQEGPAGIPAGPLHVFCMPMIGRRLQFGATGLFPAILFGRPPMARQSRRWTAASGPAGQDFNIQTAVHCRAFPHHGLRHCKCQQHSKSKFDLSGAAPASSLNMETARRNFRQAVFPYDCGTFPAHGAKETALALEELCIFCRSSPGFFHRVLFCVLLHFFVHDRIQIEPADIRH